MKYDIVNYCLVLEAIKFVLVEVYDRQKVINTIPKPSDICVIKDIVLTNVETLLTS